MSKRRPRGDIRWNWLASKIWRGQQGWVFFYRDAYPQSDIELVDRRLRKGYIEIDGDLMRLTELGKKELGLSNESGRQTIAGNRREARAEK